MNKLESMIISILELSYWRMGKDRVEKDYPKSYESWKGIPTSIDAAFTGIGKSGIFLTICIKFLVYYFIR